MVEIKIDVVEFDYLRKSSLAKNIITEIQNNASIKFTSVYLKINKSTAEKILDFLGNELMLNGLLENNEPNSIGLMVEGIIDKLVKIIY